MSNDFKLFIKRLTKCILAVIIGIPWGFLSLGWVLLHGFPFPTSPKTLTFSQQLTEIVGAIIFAPATLVIWLYQVFDTSNIISQKLSFLPIFIFSIILTYILLTLIEKIIVKIKHQ